MEEYLKLDVQCELDSFRRSIQNVFSPVQFHEKKTARLSSRITSKKLTNLTNKVDDITSKKMLHSSKPNYKKTSSKDRMILPRLVSYKDSRTTPYNSSNEHSPTFTSINSYYKMEEDAII